MSRIGKSPVVIPEKTDVVLHADHVVVKGPKGELKVDIDPSFVTVAQEENQLVFTPTGETKEHKSRHGLYRSLVNNAVEGVNEGFKKQLLVKGVGYRFKIQGQKIELNLGYSHPIHFEAPAGVTITANPDNNQVIDITGLDKQLVGQVAADIREFRKPEPYKGKGVRYIDEQIAMKAGKSVG